MCGTGSEEREDVWGGGEGGLRLADGMPRGESVKGSVRENVMFSARLGQ
jgi:hypothetical protein